MAQHSLHSVIPETLASKIIDNSLTNAVANSKVLFACPTIGCTACVELDCIGAFTFICPVCEESCTVGGDELVDPELAAWALEVGAIQCPRCAVFVTKNNLSQQNTQRAECHKMLCRCGHKFCFKCKKDLSAGICSCTSHKHGFVDPETKQLVVDEVADAANATKETQSQTSGKKRLRQSNLHDVLDPKKTKTSSASGSG